MGLSTLEQTLRVRLDERIERMRCELAEHVAIPTGHNHVVGLDRYRTLLHDRLEALGARCELIPGEPRPAWLALPGSTVTTDEQAPPTLIAQGPRHGDTPRVLLAGHLDTVHDPAGPFNALTIAPDGRTATGPGVVDMKGGILIALHALEVLHECGVELNWTVLLNSDEETGSFHSAAALRAAAREHDIGIALEPALADGSLAVERMGSGQFRIDAYGRSAHVGRAFTEGVSAVTALGNALVALGEMSEPERGIIVNAGPLQGGAVTNAVPDHAVCWGNVRYTTLANGEEIGRRLDRLATNADAMPRIEVRRVFSRPAKPLTPAVQTLADAARGAAETLGQRLPFASTGGVCDGNIMQDARLPTIDTLGVRGGNLHRSDEFIDLTSLGERSQLLAVLLSRIAAGQVHVVEEAAPPVG